VAGHLWLIGMMGSGKSVVGRTAAARFGMGFTDTDDAVARRIGRTIADFWDEHGEEAFRDIEAAAVAGIAAGSGRVVATGGGVVLRASNVAAMNRSGLVIWLQARPETLARRVAENTRRPLLNTGDPGSRLSELLAERTQHYRAASDATIATDDLELETVVDRVEALWNE